MIKTLLKIVPSSVVPRSFDQLRGRAGNKFSSPGKLGILAPQHFTEDQLRVAPLWNLPSGKYNKLDLPESGVDQHQQDGWPEYFEIRRLWAALHSLGKLKPGEGLPKIQIAERAGKGRAKRAKKQKKTNQPFSEHYELVKLVLIKLHS